MGLKDYVHSGKISFNIFVNIQNWTEFLNTHFSKKSNKMIVKLRTGAKYVVRPYESDVTMLMETWGLKCYNPKGFEIKKNDVVFDIGTHIGSFSIYAAKQAFQGKVFSFEPLPENYEIFMENIKLNKVKNIIPLKAAVSSKNGKDKLFLFEGLHTGSSSLYTRNTKKYVQINTVTLEKIIKKNKIKRINFMKIDCEGAEYDILFNLPKNILKIIDKISMEYHDKINEHNHKELVSFFKENGWKTIIKEKDGFIYARNRK